MFTIPYVSCVMCQVSGVKCHVSQVMCHVSHVNKKTKTKLQSGGASWSRVCYQRGLPRLVYPLRTCQPCDQSPCVHVSARPGSWAAFRCNGRSVFISGAMVRNGSNRLTYGTRLGHLVDYLNYVSKYNWNLL